MNAEDLARALDLAKRGPESIGALNTKVQLVYGEDPDTSIEGIVTAIEQEGEGGPTRSILRRHLAVWDHTADAEWVAETRANTTERRARIYDLLEVPEGPRPMLTDRLPIFRTAGPIVIAAPNWMPWYDPSRRVARTFYWDQLCCQLDRQLRWPAESIVSLDESTNAVVERLADPLDEKTYQAKGLVVGYVQSGKTANITGVIAKAADAGYRLVIVLAGTLNLLREQTQRRLDRELIGRELLDDEYADDSEWEHFVTHGGRPSQLGAFDWVRLTNRASDYRRLAGGMIESLRFDPRDASKPFNHPDNLHTTAAKLLVVKKHSGVLEKLAKDLNRINENGELSNVPALIIDDESDQASVNTLRPTDAEELTKRTAVNGAIVQLLKTLPRAQYIGYTATPFANVFVDPADSADLFPKDFIVGLPRPSGYMGASDFHDLDGLPSEADDDPYASNERAYVRSLRGEDSEEDNLLRAIDSFYISGAIKLYRMRRDPLLDFRHHILMIHTSMRVADHQGQADLARKLLKSSGYQTGAARKRLQDLFASDFQAVSEHRAPHLPFPVSFDELEDHLAEFQARLNQGDEAVLVVNSTGDASKLAFDTEPVWKIIVGGAKLSRGFTVEGLTISYFRRKSKSADTLMQMGRWCGFRRGYDDLIRLFIGRGEESGGRLLDVYEAFEAVCRDEEAFRDELKRYALPSDGDRPITPMEIPPLVRSHLEWVRPTARNKMFNARITFRNFGGKWSEHRRVVQSSTDKRHNERLFQDLLTDGARRMRFEAGPRSLNIFGAVVKSAVVRELLDSYRWSDGSRDLAAEMEFLDGANGDPCVDDWLVALPQLVAPTKRAWKLGEQELSVHRRGYWNDTPPLVNAYAGPEDRAFAEMVAGLRPHDKMNADLAQLRSLRRGVMLAYPISHEPPADVEWVPTIGISLLFPRNGIARQIGFSVADPTRATEPIIDS